MKRVSKKRFLRIISFAAVYTLLFAVCSFLIFGYFSACDRTLISSDGIRQHYIAFAYFGKYVRGIIKGFITNKTLTVPSFSFGIGFGGDILQTLNYYVIGDPLNLISVAFPVRLSYMVYTFLIYFRLWLAGITFSLFCRHKGIKSRAGICAGALCYAFAGYTLNFGVMHPFFLNPMIYLPILLLGVDYILEGKRPYLLTVVVFVSAVSNFYFFYMLVLITAVYAVIRMIIIFGKDFKRIINSLIGIGAYSAVGVLMSSIVLVPVAAAFLSDARGGTDTSVGLLYGIGYYLRFPSALIVSTSLVGEAQTLLGFSAACVPAVTVLLLKRKRGLTEKLLLTASTVALCLPVTAVVMNGFSYPANRWVWAYGMLISFIIASVWKYMTELTAREKCIVTLATVLYAGAVFVTQSNIVCDCLVICTVMLVLTAVLCTSVNRTVKSVIALLLVASSVCANGFLYYSRTENAGFIEKFADKEYITSDLTDDLGKKVKSISDDEDFYRYSKDTEKYDYNKALLFDNNGTSAYWSIQSPYVSDFLTELELPCTFLYKYTNLDRRASLNTLLCVKYYCSRFAGRVPYGYTKLANNVLDGNSVYEADNPLTLMYTYSEYILREDYDALNPVDKQNALMSSVLLEEAPEGYNRGSIDSSSITPEYTVSANNGVEISDGEITVDNTDGFITLEFNGTENSETYLCFKNGGFENDNKSTKFTLSVTPYSGDKKKNKSVATLLTKNDDRFDGREAYTMCLGYYASALDKIEIRFNDEGRYKLDDIEIICQPLDDFEDKVNALKTDEIENIRVGTDIISAKVTAQENKILLISVPYSSGWKAYVDGEGVELLRADTMLCAIPITAGTHDIKLTYKTPYLSVGTALSAIGTVSFAAVIILTERKKKQRK